LWLLKLPVFLCKGNIFAVYTFPSFQIKSVVYKYLNVLHIKISLHPHLSFLKSSFHFFIFLYNKHAAQTVQVLFCWLSNRGSCQHKNETINNNKETPLLKQIRYNDESLIAVKFPLFLFVLRTLFV